MPKMTFRGSKVLLLLESMIMSDSECLKVPHCFIQVDRSDKQSLQEAVWLSLETRQEPQSFIMMVVVCCSKLCQDPNFAKSISSRSPTLLGCCMR